MMSDFVLDSAINHACELIGNSGMFLISEELPRLTQSREFQLMKDMQRRLTRVKLANCRARSMVFDFVHSDCGRRTNKA
jgi:hypothetical protein